MPALATAFRFAEEGASQMKEVAIKAGTLLTVHGYQTEDGLWTVRLIGEEDNTFTDLMTPRWKIFTNC